ASEQRRVLEVADNDIGAGSTKNRGRLRGGGVRVRGDPRAAEPFDGQERLDRREAVAEPKSDSGAGPCALHQRAGQSIDAPGQVRAGSLTLVKVEQQRPPVDALQASPQIISAVGHCWASFRPQTAR